jgi:hypothetical protein
MKFKVLNNEFNFNSIYSNVKSCFDDLNSFASDEASIEITNSQLVIVECLIKYCRTNKEKFYLLKNLLQLIPTNTELIKWFTNYLVITSKHPIQLLYDHLIVSSVKIDSLWIL